MTLQEAQNQLYEFLIQNDIFDIEKHWSYIGLADTAEKEQEIKEIARLTAEKYVTAEILERLNDFSYILVKPLSHFTKPIEIYPQLAVEIAKTLNQADDQQNVDPKNLTARNIEDLLIMLRVLLLNN